MGKILITLPDVVEEWFREQAWKKFGKKRGALSKAALEAILLWLGKEGGRP